MNESILIIAGKNGESAQWLKEQVEAADPGFQNWYDLNQNMRDSMMRQLDPTVSRSIIEGQYKCFDAHCKNFTYGFETEAALRDHISLHGIQLDDYSTSAAVIQKRASNISLEDREMTGIREYDPSNSETERSVLLHSPIQRRDSIKPISDYQMKGMPFSYQVNKFATATKNAGPCLRCKVLKKKVCNEDQVK